MKNTLFSLLLIITTSTLCFGQEFITEAEFHAKINERHAFGDNDQNVVIVEFWAEFNQANAFQEWDKVKRAKYFRVDVSTAPKLKKEFRIRMAPTLIVFNKGVKEDIFKASLDLLCPVDLSELQESIDDIKTANKF